MPRWCRMNTTKCCDYSHTHPQSTVCQSDDDDGESMMYWEFTNIDKLLTDADAPINGGFFPCVIEQLFDYGEISLISDWCLTGLAIGHTPHKLSCPAPWFGRTWTTPSVSNRHPCTYQSMILLCPCLEYAFSTARLSRPLFAWYLSTR